MGVGQTSPKDCSISESTYSDVIARLASAKAKVTARLFVTVKCELHQSRSKKYGSTALRMKEKSREMSSYY